jgi:hypothetical protein
MNKSEDTWMRGCCLQLIRSAPAELYPLANEIRHDEAAYQDSIHSIFDGHQVIGLSS